MCIYYYSTIRKNNVNAIYCINSNLFTGINFDALINGLCKKSSSVLSILHRRHKIAIRLLLLAISLFKHFRQHSCKHFSNCGWSSIVNNSKQKMHLFKLKFFRSIVDTFDQIWTMCDNIIQHTHCSEIFYSGQYYFQYLS